MSKTIPQDLLVGSRVDDNGFVVLECMKCNGVEDVVRRVVQRHEDPRAGPTIYMPIFGPNSKSEGEEANQRIALFKQTTGQLPGRKHRVNCWEMLGRGNRVLTRATFPSGPVKAMERPNFYVTSTQPDPRDDIYCSDCGCGPVLGSQCPECGSADDFKQEVPKRCL